MYPRIGAGAALDVVPLVVDSLNGILYHLGDRERIFLHLGTVVAGAFIAEREQDIAHGCSFAGHDYTKGIFI